MIEWPRAALPSAAEHANWQVGRVAALTRADGWLALVGLFWLDAGEQRVGSAADSEILLPFGPPRLGLISLRDGIAEWHSANGESQVLRSDADGAPTVISYDTLSFFVIERDGKLAVRVRDSDATARHHFAGIDSFPFDPSWCVDARWDGSRAHFEIAGQPCSLGPQNVEAKTLQFVFGDSTSGRETYGGGRFLFVPAPAGQTLRLDFNRAINPPCVFTPYATCPLPAPENRLKVAVTAGEKSPH